MDAQKALLVGLVCVAALGFRALAQEPKADYVGNSTCKVCHNKPAEGKQWDVWKSKPHAQAYQVLLEDKALAIAKEKGLEKPPSESPECLRCHVTAYNRETGELPAKIKKEDGVQCESCHGAGSLHQKDGQQVLLKKDTTIDIAAHLVKPDEKLCTTCHNSDSPSWNPEQYTLEDGTKVGFDFKQASKKIEHPNPLKKKAEGEPTQGGSQG